MPWSTEKKTEYARNRYRTDEAYRKHRNKLHRAAAKKRKQAGEKLVEAFRSKGCKKCKEKEPCCLVAHHLDPSKKELPIASSVSSCVSPKRIEAELAKCVCLCMNCHAKVHKGVIRL